MRTRLIPDERKELIITAAMIVAARVGYQDMTRKQIAHAAGVVPSLVTYYLGGMEEIRTAVMNAAVRTRNARVVAQGLANRDKLALAADPELRAAAAAVLAEA